jgi:quercetin dioxygenase-like cupin family protein
MLSKRNTFIRGIGVCLFLFFATLTLTSGADTTSQIVTHVDEILKGNPLKTGEQIQLITIAQDDTITVIVGRLIEGAEVKRHFHKTHDETVCVVKGTGQQMINDQWVDIKPGSVHFNPMTKVHSTKNTGSGELVFISIFTPAMKEVDRNFVQ